MGGLSWAPHTGGLCHSWEPQAGKPWSSKGLRVNLPTPRPGGNVIYNLLVREKICPLLWREPTTHLPSKGCLVQYTPAAAAAAAKSLQSCPTLCDPIDGSPPGSPIPGILQARTLEWVAIAFSNAWRWKVKAKSLSRVRLLATAWTAVYQAPPSMGFSRQEYWSGVPLPSPYYQLNTSKWS